MLGATTGSRSDPDDAVGAGAHVQPRDTVRAGRVGGVLARLVVLDRSEMVAVPADAAARRPLPRRSREGTPARGRLSCRDAPAAVSLQSVAARRRAFLLGAEARQSQDPRLRARRRAGDGTDRADRHAARGAAHGARQRGCRRARHRGAAGFLAPRRRSRSAAERDAGARWIPWLATFGSVSPLLGLLGTVLGVMDAFIGIAVGGSGNITAVAPGVAEALVTTVGGLAVAVPAVMAYNLFVNRLGLFAGELEGFAQEIVGTLAREGRI